MAQLSPAELEKLSTMPIDDIIEKFEVDKKKAYEMRREASAEVLGSGASQSLSQKILAVLKNGPAADVEALRSALFFKEEAFEASNIDITRAVWSLQKRSLVTFYERKLGGDSLLTQIKLSRNGLKELGMLPTRDMTAPSKVKPSRELKRRAQVGKDFTDEKAHRQVAQGGVIERMHAPTVDAGWKGSPAERMKDGPPNQNEKPLPVTQSSEHPLLDVLMERFRKSEGLSAAADLLEEEGETEMAAELRKKNHFSDFELEVIRFVRSHG